MNMHIASSKQYFRSNKHFTMLGIGKICLEMSLVSKLYSLSLVQFFLRSLFPPIRMHSLTNTYTNTCDLDFRGVTILFVISPGCHYMSHFIKSNVKK